MSTETATQAERVRQIRGRLAEMAPCPATDETTTAESLARWLAVRAAVIDHQQLSPDVPLSRGQIDLLTVLFAAAHALYALEGHNPALGRQVALEIRNAWDDGGGVGEWLWDHLGSTACAEIGPLADELGALPKPADGLLAHADVIREALGRAALEGRPANRREAYVKALGALDAELEQAQEESR